MQGTSITTILLIFTFSLFLSSLNLCFAAELCNPSDKKTLLGIQNHFKNASAFTSWDSNTDCCYKWFGIQCDAHGHVDTLLLTHAHDVIGEIPPTIGELSHLVSITLSNFPNLTGSIPKTIAKLTNLQHLDLSLNSLTGSIPNFFGHLKKLELIDVSYNNLIGAIPDSLPQVKSLDQVWLHHNKLTGSIPESFGSFRNSALLLILSYNQLSGPIPRSFGMAQLKQLDLSGNKFTGDASFLFGRDKTALDTIHLGDNLLKFDFSYVEFPMNLNNMDISHNVIYGSLPRGLAKLKNLEYVDVSFNQLCGPIPTSKILKQLGPSKFSDNKCLCGPPLAACTYYRTNRMQ